MRRCERHLFGYWKSWAVKYKAHVKMAKFRGPTDETAIKPKRSLKTQSFLYYGHTHTYPTFYSQKFSISFHQCATLMPLGGYGQVTHKKRRFDDFSLAFCQIFFIRFCKSHRFPFDLIFYSTIPNVRTQSVSFVFFFVCLKARMEVF